MEPGIDFSQFFSGRVLAAFPVMFGIAFAIMKVFNKRIIESPKLAPYVELIAGGVGAGVGLLLGLIGGWTYSDVLAVMLLGFTTGLSTQFANRRSDDQIARSVAPRVEAQVAKEATRQVMGNIRTVVSVQSNDPDTARPKDDKTPPRDTIEGPAGHGNQ